MATDCRALVERLISAWNDHDLEGVVAVFAPEAEVIPLRAALENVTYGPPDAARQWFEASSEVWAEATISVTEFDERGSSLLAVGRILTRGRQSGAAIEQPMAALVKCSEAGIVLLQAFTDVDAGRAAYESL